MQQAERNNAEQFASGVANVSYESRHIDLLPLICVQRAANMLCLHAMHARSSMAAMCMQQGSMLLSTAMNARLGGRFSPVPAPT